MLRESLVGEVTRGRPLHTPEVPAGEHVRVVFGKKRFDAHDVGARYVMRKLVDAGMEVVFIRFALIDELVDAAVQEDADVIALSVLTGGHLVLAGELTERLRAAGLQDRLVLVGGVIADDDQARLHELGVDGVFGPGSRPDDIVAFIDEHAGGGR
jgi:methylmalonyl-CoA mutase C-terminal domain/subunit